MDRTINYMNENLCPVNIYLTYDILLSKLNYYGLQWNALQLLKSYMVDVNMYSLVMLSQVLIVTVADSLFYRNYVHLLVHVVFITLPAISACTYC